MDSYVLNKAVLSEDEQSQILFALQGLSVTQGINGADVLGKLQSLFDKTDTSWIEVDFSRWGNSMGDKTKFELLKNGIIKKQALAFRYYSSYGQSGNRKVYPLKLVFKSKAWYLQAFCPPQNNYRTFKVNRMLDIEILDETFNGMRFHPPEIDTADYQSPHLLEVKLFFSSQVAYRVLRRILMKRISLKMRTAHSSFPGKCPMITGFTTISFPLGRPSKFWSLKGFGMQ